MLETAPLAAGRDGGGGVRLPPPRLLGPEPESAAEEVAPLFADDPAAEESFVEGELPATLESASLQGGARGGGGVRLPPPALFAPADGLDAEDAALESLLALETAPLVAGPDGGGGVRLPPPRLLGPEPESAAEEVAPPLDAVAAAEESFVEGELPVALESASLQVGARGGGGVRLPPPALLAPADGLDAEDAALESLLVLETAPLAAGRDGGGGVRLPPPRLLGSTADIEELPYLDSLVTGAESAPRLTVAQNNGGGGVRVPPPALLGGLDKAHVLQDTQGSYYSGLNAADLLNGPSRGGGLRVPPPHLLSSEDTGPGVEGVGPDASSGTTDSRAEDGTSFTPNDDPTGLLAGALDELVTAPLLSSWHGGGGIALPPSALRVFGEPLSSNDEQRTPDEVRLPHTPQRQPRAKAGEVLCFSSLTVGWDGGGGIRISPAVLQAPQVAVEAQASPSPAAPDTIAPVKSLIEGATGSEDEFDHQGGELETASLLPGPDGGGGLLVTSFPMTRPEFLNISNIVTSRHHNDVSEPATARMCETVAIVSRRRRNEPPPTSKAGPCTPTHN